MKNELNLFTQSNNACIIFLTRLMPLFLFLLYLYRVQIIGHGQRTNTLGWNRVSSVFN